MLPMIGVAGGTLTDTMVDAVAVQLAALVTVTEYAPLIAVVELVRVGFCSVLE